MLVMVMVLVISVLIATDTATPVIVLLRLMLLRVLDSPDMVAHTAAPATHALAFLLDNYPLL